MTQEPSLFIVKLNGVTKSKMYSTLGRARRWIRDNAESAAACKYRQDTGGYFWGLPKARQTPLVAAQIELFEIVGLATVEVGTFPPVNLKKTKKVVE